MEIDYRSITIIVDFLGCYLLFAGIYFFIVFMIIRARISRVFTEKYSEIKKQHPAPLKTWRWKTGAIGRTSSVFRFRISNLLKVEVYPYMLLVSALGRAICLPYSRYQFKHEKFIFNF